MSMSTGNEDAEHVEECTGINVRGRKLYSIGKCLPANRHIYFQSVIIATKLGAGGGIEPGVIGTFDLGGSLVRMDKTAITIRAVPR
jgi:hypothetical protein